jgi:cytosine deaminase
VLLQNATLASDVEADIRLQGGSIVELGPPGALAAAAGEEALELSGFLLLPAFAEPHTHLDKALTAARFSGEFTHLGAAIAAWHAHRETLDASDISERATRAALMALANGATAIRTHADVGSGIGLRSVEALIRVREELSELIDIQVVAMTYPLTGTAGVENRALLREALAMGADVAGGAPHVDPDPAGQVEVCLDEAALAGCPVDLHADENMRPASVDLVALIARVAAGFPHPATASHCVSLGVLAASEQAERAAATAEAGISVVTCPVANLYLQGRDTATATPRGLTAIRALRVAGVTLAGGGDNIQDCFIPVGRADPLITAQYLVVGGQMAVAEALELVSGAARRVMGLPEITVSAGCRADLVAVAARSPAEAVATATPERLVFRRGELAYRSRLESRGGAITSAHH